MYARLSSINYLKLFQASLVLWCCYLLGCATSPHETQTTAATSTATLNLAVWDFDNNSMTGSDVDYLSKALSEMLLTGLAQTPGIRLVERVNLRQALEEQNLGNSQLASEESRLKLGRLVGANHMAFGSYVAMGAQIRIDVRVVDVETSLVKFSEDAITPPSDVAKHMQTIAQHLAGKLANSSLTANNPTTEMALWKRYETGIALMDQHQYEQALAVFTDLLKTAPNFKAAEKQLQSALELQSRQ
jgi:curli biogenesis system outer membrane secretion channel CsgG